MYNENALGPGGLTNPTSPVSGRIPSRTREARPGGLAARPRCRLQQDLRHPAGADRVVPRHGCAIRGASAMQLHRGTRLPERGGVSPVRRQSSAGRTIESCLRAAGRCRSGSSRVSANRRDSPPSVSEGTAAARRAVYPRRQTAQRTHS